VRQQSKATLLCSDLVDLVWSDDRGVARHTRAILEEIAPASAMLLLDSERPPRRTSAVVIQPFGYSGRARWCRSSASGFRLEIDFDPGVRWDAGDYQPCHSFDPGTVPEALGRNFSAP
jgi:hypothetical protein